MREALSALTTRGRAFVAGGITALVCAFLMGEDSLLRIGALVIALPLVTGWFLGRANYRIGLARSVSPLQVVAGQRAEVTLDLTNEGRTPTGLLLLEDQIPYVLGTRPRFVLDGMGPRWKRRVGYTVRADVRGKYTVGPMTVRITDPFGLIEMNRTFRSTGSLTVTPRVIPLPAIPLAGVWTGSGDNRPRAFASGSAEDVTVREYRRGDDLRRVHWRSSARVGDLMVRREEQPWQSRATLFLDNRAASHRGSGAASSLETAVSVAASVGVHLSQRGFVVRLVTASGEEVEHAWHEHSAITESGPLLESLAVVQPLRTHHVDTSWLQESSTTGLLIGVLGSITEHDRAVFGRMRHHTSAALGIALDTPAWTRRGPAAGTTTSTAAWLNAHGWRAVDYGPEDHLVRVWQELGTTARQHVRASGSTPEQAS